MASLIQFKRATAERWRELNPILASGEPGYVKNATEPGQSLKIGDGRTPWNDLPFAGAYDIDISEVIAKAHEHKNKSVLDSIDDARVAAWDVAVSNSITLTQALENKVDKVEGMGLSERNFTSSLLAKLTSIEEGAQVNIIEGIRINGIAATITDKIVDLPVGGTVLGLVMSSSAENGVTIKEDGTMEVNSVNVNKLVQTDGDFLVLESGSAIV